MQHTNSILPVLTYRIIEVPKIQLNNLNYVKFEYCRQYFFMLAKSAFTVEIDPNMSQFDISRIYNRQ